MRSLPFPFALPARSLPVAATVAVAVAVALSSAACGTDPRNRTSNLDLGATPPDFTYVGSGIDDDGGSIDPGGGPGGGVLGTIDITKLSLKTVGALNGNPELTGTGDATLFGFFPDATMPRVSQIDKVTGKEGTTYPLAKIAGSPSAWAFA